ncbi:hypothetical protein ACJX0J_017272 [Zea mays]
MSSKNTQISRKRYLIGINYFDQFTFNSKEDYMNTRYGGEPHLTEKEEIESMYPALAGAAHLLQESNRQKELPEGLQVFLCIILCHSIFSFNFQLRKMRSGLDAEAGVLLNLILVLVGQPNNHSEILKQQSFGAGELSIVLDCLGGNICSAGFSF